MKQYLKLLANVLNNGSERSDRTGVGTIGIFGPQMEFDLQDGFPLLTTKKLHLRSIIYELLWFLSGSTNIKYLQENGVTIWNEWANPDGELGAVYGKQWRDFGGRAAEDRQAGYEWIHNDAIEGIDQIKNLLEGLKNDPFSRRHIVTAWNPQDLDKCKLPCCHCFFQMYVRNHQPRTLDQDEWITTGPVERYLDCKMYQRSADVFLGVPYNLTSYSLLTMMVAQVVGLKPGKFIHTFGDTHLYKNHINQAREQLKRMPKSLPKMIINPEVKDIFSFKYEDFKIEGYNPDPHIKAEIAV